MAQRVDVVLIDDIDQSQAVETVTFGIDRAMYEIDLNEKHAANLRKALALYMESGRRIRGNRKRETGSASQASSNGVGGASTADIRAWAKENGYELAERGRISAEVRQAYDAAH